MIHLINCSIPRFNRFAREQCNGLTGLKAIQFGQIGSLFGSKRRNKPELLSIIPEMEQLFLESKYNSGLESIRALLQEYENWKEEIVRWRATDADSILSPKLIKRLDEHIDSINSVLLRMRGGLALLESSRDASQAFRLANEAIFKSATSIAGNQPGFKWRPFQLCFILLNLQGLIWDEEGSNDDERKIIDLAWFPTGGGKTEAYFGLIAILGFYRQIKHVDTIPSVHRIIC